MMRVSGQAVAKIKFTNKHAMRPIIRSGINEKHNLLKKNSKNEETKQTMELALEEPPYVHSLFNKPPGKDAGIGLMRARTNSQKWDCDTSTKNNLTINGNESCKSKTKQ